MLILGPSALTEIERSLKQSCSDLLDAVGSLGWNVTVTSDRLGYHLSLDHPVGISIGRQDSDSPLETELGERWAEYLLSSPEVRAVAALPVSPDLSRLGALRHLALAHEWSFAEVYDLAAAMIELQLLRPDEADWLVDYSADTGPQMRNRSRFVSDVRR